MQDNYTYTLSPQIADQKNPIDDFILDGKQGYCTHFAAAMVIMLESVGVDARMVGGFYSSFYDVDLDAYIMFSTDLHAWVEVYEPDRWEDRIDWVTYDPTPEGSSDNSTAVWNKWNGIKRNYVLNGVNQKLSFDDIYDKKALDERVFDKRSADSSNDDSKDSSVSKKSVKELKEEVRKHKEDIKKKKEDMAKFWNIMKYVLSGFLGLLIVVLFVWVGILVYRRLFKASKKDQNEDKELMRKLDEKIRLRFKDELELTKEDLQVSSKLFFKKLDEIDGVSAELLDCYRHLNKVLYAQKYSKEDVDAVVIFVRQ